MNDKEIVLSRYPKAFVFQVGVKKEIRRPREKSDPPALVRYVLMSSVGYSDDVLWKEARERMEQQLDASLVTEEVRNAIRDGLTVTEK